MIENFWHGALSTFLLLSEISRSEQRHGVSEASPLDGGVRQTSEASNWATSRKYVALLRLEVCQSLVFFALSGGQVLLTIREIAMSSGGAAQRA